MNLAFHEFPGQQTQGGAVPYNICSCAAPSGSDGSRYTTSLNLLPWEDGDDDDAHVYPAGHLPSWQATYLASWWPTVGDDDSMDAGDSASAGDSAAAGDDDDTLGPGDDDDTATGSAGGYNT